MGDFMARSTTRTIRRLLAGTLSGAAAVSITAVVTTDTQPATTNTDATTASMAATDHSTPAGNDAADVKASPPEDSTVLGAAGTGLAAAMTARAEGVAVTAPDRLAARPTVSTISGTRSGTEPIVRSGGLVTAHGVDVHAAVVDGHSLATARVAAATYGRHDLGGLAVTCRDGHATAERTDIVRLATNITVQYGAISGQRATGAIVLVLGRGDRPVRVVSLVTVDCTPPPGPATGARTGTIHGPGTGPAAQDKPGLRRLVPRTPATPVHSGPCVGGR
jgi:hypothetical protein